MSAVGISQTKGNLARRSALVVGAGGLGGPAALALAASGVGRITVMDPDRIEASNLHRQLLYDAADLGQPKAATLARKIEARFPGTALRGLSLRLDAENALALFSEHDVVVDGSDNFATKFLCSDAAVLCGRSLVHAGILRFSGQILSILPRRSACYRCLFEAPPAAGAAPSCAEAGVMGFTAGLVGALQAAEALRLLTWGQSPSAGRLLVCDLRAGAVREVEVGRDPRCWACGDAAGLRALDPAAYRPVERCEVPA